MVKFLKYVVMLMILSKVFFEKEILSKIVDLNYN